MAVLVTGGARSGKSRFAEQYAAALGAEGVYIATSQALDEEMKERVRQHRLRRERAAFRWRTVEEPFELVRALDAARGRIVLIDCLTLWLSNCMLRLEDEPDADAVLQAKIEEMAEAISRFSSGAARADDQAAGVVIAVTNEVGCGVVPAYSLGRRFRDWAGWMNQRIAEVCNEVFLVTAGIPVELKRLAYSFPEGDPADR